jgi:RyR domain
MTALDDGENQVHPVRVRCHEKAPAMPEIDSIAAAIHETWRSLSRQEGWSMSPQLDRAYADLAEPDKANNRAAASRMGDVLALAGLTLSDDPAKPTADLPANLEPMAEAEHNGWMEQRARTGWSWAATRDDAAKHHPSMVPYAQLSEQEKEKDRSNIRHYPEFAARAGYRIVAMT